MYSKYNQQDATLYNILYYVNAPHVSGGFSAHQRELKNCTHSIGYIPSLLAATASGSSKQVPPIFIIFCSLNFLLHYLCPPRQLYFANSSSSSSLSAVSSSQNSSSSVETYAGIGESIPIISKLSLRQVKQFLSRNWTAQNMNTLINQNVPVFR